jgi:hypothetical protein
MARYEDSRSTNALQEENARLRRELLRKRTHSPMWPVVGGLAAHIVLRPLLDPWLNAASDAKVGAAAVILGIPILFAVFMLVRALRSKQG